MERHHPDGCNSAALAANCRVESRDDRQRTQRRGVGNGHLLAQRLDDDGRALVIECRERRAALNDRAGEKTVSVGRRERVQHDTATRRLATATTRAGSPPKCVMCGWIHSSAVSASRTPQFATRPRTRASRNPTRPEPIVHGNGDDRLLGRDKRPVVDRW